MRPNSVWADAAVFKMLADTAEVVRDSVEPLASTQCGPELRHLDPSLNWKSYTSYPTVPATFQP